jgi:hypothetical protein
MTTPTPDASPVLITFGLQDQEAALTRALRVTNAAIHGGAALSWYTNTEPPAGQDIDIWCQPVARILSPVIVALYDTIFRTVGYSPVPPSSRAARDYYGIRNLHIDAIHNWFNPTVNRKIQLILRSKDAPSADPTTEFDLDITTVKVSAPADTAAADRLLVTVPSTELAVRIRRRVMNINNLKGQHLQNNLRRIHKYYSRGFAFESTEARCSCSCGAVHHMTVTPPHRLSLKEAMDHVRKEWVAANPLPDHYALRADVLKRYITTHYAGDALLTANRTTLNDLRESCTLANRLYQNAALYPAETTWLLHYRKALQGLWLLRRIQHWTADEFRPSLRSYMLLQRYQEQLHQVERNPILDMYPGLRVELDAVRTNIDYYLTAFDDDEAPLPAPARTATKETPSPSLVKVVTDDTDFIKHV